MRPDISLHVIERQVIEAMESHGITPPRDGLILDGEIHRYPVEVDKRGAKSGAYQIHVDGWPAGWFMDWHSGESVKWRYRPDDAQRREWRKYQPSNAQRRDRAAEAEVHEVQRQEENVAKLETAWAAYSAARPIDEADEHGYLLAKHVRPVGGFPFGGVWCGLRVDTKGNLLIPLQDVKRGQFIGLHRVFARPNADGKFSKGWATSAGGVYPIGSDLTRSMVICCEGIATGLALYELWSVGLGESVTVLCLMDAGNLARQALAIRDHHRGRELYVAIDDDPAGRKAGAACMSAGFSGILEPPRGERE